MFLASALSFLLATVQAGAYIAIPSMFLHSALVGNQSLPLTEKILQANDLLLKPNVVVAWMASFEVRVLNGQNFRVLVLPRRI